ncbi:MAG: flagellar biosynthesis protein FlhA [Bacillota bacterium]|nr:flagellar biosynthesis protein FlhA [Bacillota bacterium]MDK2881722.1 flagellar biosynthesis protein FlhA [Bacillota bacterium]
MAQFPNAASARSIKYGDLWVTVAVVAVVGMMIIPLPTWLLDLLLTFNITFSLTVLLVTMYVHQPLEISVFPSLLLVATLFRLALNVSSTRLILSRGDAGRVIAAFGQFVVGGNPVVGFIVFLILVVIQFIVITRGAERVAEVAARFTLDAMPGKQMSIDADLNAGLITEEEARARRREVRREADFYGAMDGASKFVKGDAIAGLIITLVNIIGGFIIGAMQGNMTLSEVLAHYTLLTVGDGLVSQLPALLISTATGIIVTRAASEGNLGEDLTEQVFTEPRVLWVAAALLAVLGLVPGLPHLAFLTLAVLFAFLAWRLGPERGTAAPQAVPERAKELEDMRRPEAVAALLPVDTLEVDLGYGLISLADAEQGGDLLDRVVLLRRQLALELGLIVPTVRIRDNITLSPNTYVILLKGVEVARGEVLPGYYLAMGELKDGPAPGLPTREPAFGLPAWWVSAADKEKAERAGFTVVDPATVIATHLTEVIKAHADEILGRREVELMLETLRKDNAVLVNEVIPGVVSALDLKKILGNLLHEGVSIRDLGTILETLGNFGRLTKDTDLLTEYVRQALGRQISRQLAPEKGPLIALTLDREVEETIDKSLQRTEQGTYLALDPVLAERILANLKVHLQHLQPGQQPVVLCSPLVRFYFKRLTERVFPRLAVISYNELDPSLQVEVVGRVGLK